MEYSEIEDADRVSTWRAEMRRAGGRETPEESRVGASPRASGLLDEKEVRDLEREFATGLTSRQIVDVFETRGIRFSEATLRKYVQLGLLPRSVRVGRKGKHRGSCGLYPPEVVGRVNEVKRMMADNRTIEDIQRTFARFQENIDGVANGLREVIAGLEREAKGPSLDADRRRELEREIQEARKAVGDLVRRISTLEQRIARGGAESRGPAAGSDLF